MLGACWALKHAVCLREKTALCMQGLNSWFVFSFTRYSSGYTVACPKVHAGFMNLLVTGFEQSEVPQVFVKVGGPLIMKLIGTACLQLVLVLVLRIWGCLSRPCLWLGSAENVHLSLSLVLACLHSPSPVLPWSDPSLCCLSSLCTMTHHSAA